MSTTIFLQNPLLWNGRFGFYNLFMIIAAQFETYFIKMLHLRVKTTLSAIIITDNYFTVQIFTEIIVSYLACGQLFVGYVTNVEDRCVYRIPENHILIWAALSMSFRRISINKQNSLRSPSNI